MIKVSKYRDIYYIRLDVMKVFNGFYIIGKYIEFEFNFDVNLY